MFLSATMLKSVQNVNSFQRTTTVPVRLGNPTTLYIQLTDAEQTDSYGNALRYMPAVGATLTITIDNISGTNNISNRAASQPYSQDSSIWALTVTSSDVLRSGNITGTLTEGATVRTFVIQSAITVQSTNMEYC